MQQIWAIVAVLVAFFLILHVRNRKKRTPEPKVYARRIEGSQITAFLHPRVNVACLADHGVQFGKGFRRKEGPALPHDDGCRCHPVHFSYTSNEVFQGALRRPAPPGVSIPGLRDSDAVALLDVLRSWEGSLLGGNAEETLARVNWSRFSPGHREALETFMRERLAFLAERGAPKALSPA